jgi:hypothetical protein
MSTRFTPDCIRRTVRRAGRDALRDSPTISRDDLINAIAKRCGDHLYNYARLRGLPKPSAQPTLDGLGAPPPKDLCRKHGYKKLRQALAAALDLESRGRGPVEAYRCPRCLRFHLTSEEQWETRKGRKGARR